MKFAPQPDPTRLASFDFKGLRIYTDLFNSCIILGLIVHIILILNVYWQRELITYARETFTQHDSPRAHTHTPSESEVGRFIENRLFNNRKLETVFIFICLSSHCSLFMHVSFLLPIERNIITFFLSRISVPT